jgi:hypothetical protein
MPPGMHACSWTHQTARVFNGNSHITTKRGGDRLRFMTISSGRMMSESVPHRLITDPQQGSNRRMIGFKP